MELSAIYRNNTGGAVTKICCCVIVFVVGRRVAQNRLLQRYLSKEFPMSLSKLTLILVLTIGAVTPQIALAYVGPGAGLSAIGTLVALAGAVLLAIVGFVWYPVKRLLKKRKTASVDAESKVEPDQK